MPTTGLATDGSRISANVSIGKGRLSVGRLVNFGHIKCSSRCDAPAQSGRWRRNARAGRSPARRDPGKGLTDAGVVGGHLRRPEQALQFARVVADWLHIIGGDRQQPAQSDDKIS
jgi:hypothetical protein